MARQNPPMTELVIRTPIPEHYKQPQFARADLCAEHGHELCRGLAVDEDANILVCECRCHEEGIAPNA